MTTIQVCDAGTTCLLLGAVVGLTHEGRREFVKEEIPVNAFQEEAYERREFQDRAREMVELHVLGWRLGPDTKFEVQDSFLLDETRKWLATQGFQVRVQRFSTSESVRALAESEFLGKLIALGVPEVTIELMTREPGLFFYKCLQWLKDGKMKATRPHPDRVQHAKTGWKSFQVYAYHPYDEAKRLIAAQRGKRDGGKRGRG